MRCASRALWLAALSLVGIPFAAGAQETSPCDRLAREARDAPPGAWASDNPWTAAGKAPALAFESQSRKPSPFEARLASLPWVKDATSADDEWTVSVERLPGTDVYMASTIQGTLDCQTSVFLEAKPGAKPKSIAAPMEFGESDVCWTVSGDFGRVFGQPAFIKHGALTDHTDDEDISIVPWTGRGWGKMCKLELRFRRNFALARTFCGDPAICRAGSATAVDVAAAYNKLRDQTDTNLDFRFGSPPPKAALDAARRASETLQSDTSTPEFPTFGATSSADAPRFSYNGFTFFPLALNGTYYVGAIGHDGVGWRESGRTLFAVYSEARGSLTPLAGFEVDLSNGGLVSATAEKPASK